jgi:membrane protease YdiL (CAAX protease family)
MDLVKCIKYALIISIIIVAFTAAVFLIIHKGFTLLLLSSIKNCLYYAGCFALFISIAFFLQKNTLRPLDHEKEWKNIFHELSLSFVVMFTGLFICCNGMILQFIYESL